MELELVRTYFPEGTNGVIFHNGVMINYSIELPWLNNQHRVSCIPEGRYQLQIRFSHRLQWHLQLKNVKDRDLILIHPANNAMKELKGCIAPVSILTGPGTGLKSKIAFHKLIQYIFPELDKNNPVFITIKSSSI